MKILNKLKIFFAFALLISLPIKTLAAEQINQFQVNINVNKDGTVDYEEIIEYNFGPDAVDRHGIIREIPLDKTNQEGKTFLMKISNIEIPKYNYSKTMERDRAILKIGDANVTVSGVKTYTIRYTISGALTYFVNKDELYWNVTGDEWSVPIANSEVNILLPEEIDLENVSTYCYTGFYGDDNKKCSIIKSEDIITAQTNNFLQPSEGFTIAIGFPKGYVAELFPEEDKMPIWLTIILAIIGLIVFTLSVLWYIIAPIKLVLKIIRNNKRQNENERIVAAWFQPPEYSNNQQFTPAETSTIVTNSVDNKAITSTIIQLAQKGYMKIHVEGKKKIRFEQLNKNTSDLFKFEREIYDAIFKSSDDVKLKTLSKSESFYNAITKFKKDVKTRLSDKKMYEENLVKFDNKNMGLMVLGFITMNIIYSLIRIFFRKNLISRTTEGIEKYSEALSLKNFLVSQDEQLDYQADQQLFFEKLLPYATAFGVEDVWIKKFDNLKFDTSGWYDGDITNAVVLNSLTNNINRTVTSASSYAAGTRSSSGFSSGSSGGGFSGGGGGGGGGSSW